MLYLWGSIGKYSSKTGIGSTEVGLIQFVDNLELRRTRSPQWVVVSISGYNRFIAYLGKMRTHALTLRFSKTFNYVVQIRILKYLVDFFFVFRKLFGHRRYISYSSIANTKISSSSFSFSWCMKSFTSLKFHYQNIIIKKINFNLISEEQNTVTNAIFQTNIFFRLNRLINILKS